MRAINMNKWSLNVHLSLNPSYFVVLMNCFSGKKKEHKNIKDVHEESSGSPGMDAITKSPTILHHTTHTQ